MIMDMLKLHKMQIEKNIDVVYSGPIWSEGIGEIARTLQKHLEYENVSENKAKEIMSVYVEQMNNMLMYSAENIDEFPGGSFLMGREGEDFYIQTGNVMKDEHMELIKSRIDHLNTLDKDGIRKYYKEQMKMENQNPQSKGSGLGFIEIARRVKSKIEYSFVPYKNGLTYFTLYATMEAGGDNEQ